MGSSFEHIFSVLFPGINISNNFRVGELDFIEDNNVIGILQTYITTHINGCKNISLVWKKGISLIARFLTLSLL